DSLSALPKIAQTGDGGGVELLHECDHQVHGAVEIRAVNHAVVGVGVAGGDHDVDRRYAAVALLDHRGIVAVPRDQVRLERNVGGVGDLLDKGDQLAVGQLAGVIKENPGTAAEPLLRALRADAGNVAGDANLQRQADVGLDGFGGAARAAFADLLLHGRSVVDLVRMRAGGGQALHHLDHHRAAHAVVPGLGHVAPVGQHLEGRIGGDRVALGDAERSHVGGAARAGVQINAVARDHPPALGGGGDVDIPD